ncbi:MAG: hypothetical protein WKF34_06965 [Pyrinomonadaceae bacterium]
MKNNDHANNSYSEEFMPASQPAMYVQGSIEDSVEKQIKGRVTLYISKEVLKAFKHRAIDEDKDFSALAEDVFMNFLKDPKETSK